MSNKIIFRLLFFAVIFWARPYQAFGAEYLVDVTRFGAVADARKINGVWVGTDNSKALNGCAAYCRANGLTMFFPKGNYGVASTIWLTNPDKDKRKQASITVIGSNRGAFWDQWTSANICVLKDFEAGKIAAVKKKDGLVNEPYIVPVLAVSNGRQVHIEGLGIQGNNKTELICGLAIGNISQLTSIRNCSIENTYAGIVFPGIRASMNESVIEGNNDLLVVEQSTLSNAYNIVCAGTQPFACEYRNSSFRCIFSVFTGTLIRNFYGHSRGSHKFSSNLFSTSYAAKDQDTVFFDLHLNEVTIDSCHFETSSKEHLPRILTLVRQLPYGGHSFREQRFAFTNNFVNFALMNTNVVEHRPLIDTMVGNRMIFQGNTFHVGAAMRIKASGAVFIGNIFRLSGPHDLNITDDAHPLDGSAGDVRLGLYDFNHFIRTNSEAKICLPDGTGLKKGKDYKVRKDLNAFEITKDGKEKIDKAKASKVLISYQANDASGIFFEAWSGNTFNPPRGWRSKDLTLIANKLIGKTELGQLYERELRAKQIYELPIKR